jgi:uncharacterized protein
MIIDFHVHCGLKVYDKQVYAPYKVTCGNVELMKKTGVDRICVSGDNEVIAKLIKDFKGYVDGFIYFRLGKDKPSLIDSYRAKGFLGAKFIFPLRAYDDERNWPVYGKIEKYGMPTLFHTAVVAGAGQMWQVKERVSSNYTKPINLDKVARCFPKMKIVGAHLGDPWYGEAMMMARWLPNLYFDLCIGQLSCMKGNKFCIKQSIKEAYEEGDLNAEKLLYGSDCFIDKPQKKFTGGLTWSLRTMKAEMELLGMTEAEKKKIMYQNAVSILNSN